MQIPEIYKKQLIEKGYIKQGKDFKVDTKDPEFLKLLNSKEWYWIKTTSAYTKIEFI